MKKIKLSKRLALIAGFVSSGKGVVDVGTDHGYVPIYLAQNGYQGKIYASDIREGPLSHAKKFAVEYDDAGSIGKRYRRQDEIGTPLCITYDFDSETDGCVTVRERDSMQQTRIKIDSLEDFIAERISL